MPSRSHTRTRRRLKRSRRRQADDHVDHASRRQQRRDLADRRLGALWPFGCCHPPTGAGRGEVADLIRAHSTHAPVPRI